MSLTLEVFPVGTIDTNCYFVTNETNQVLIVDPGGDAEVLISKIKHRNLTPVAIILTHAHVDHLGGIEGLANEFAIPVCLNENDWELYLSPKNELLPWLPRVPNLPQPQEYKEFENFKFQVIPTPGHTQGGVCIYFADEEFVITGDTLFDGAIGRTDLPGGNFQQLVNSIKENLFTLPDNTKIYPGHGPSSTILRCKHTDYLF